MTFFFEHFVIFGHFPSPQYLSSQFGFSGTFSGLLNRPCLNYVFCNPLGCIHQQHNYVSHKLILKLSFLYWSVISYIPSYIPNSKLGNVIKIFFGIHSQILPLKLSFAFWILPSKHFSNSVPLLNSKNIGFK